MAVLFLSLRFAGLGEKFPLSLRLLSSIDGGKAKQRSPKTTTKKTKNTTISTTSMMMTTTTTTLRLKAGLPC